ncbi:hypothetical protein NUACC21_30160 [Scytonema sp. NUACC21]
MPNPALVKLIAKINLFDTDNQPPLQLKGLNFFVGDALNQCIFGFWQLKLFGDGAAGDWRMFQAGDIRKERLQNIKVLNFRSIRFLQGIQPFPDMTNLDGADRVHAGKTQELVNGILVRSSCFTMMNVQPLSYQFRQCLHIMPTVCDELESTFLDLVIGTNLPIKSP